MISRIPHLLRFLVTIALVLAAGEFARAQGGVAYEEGRVIVEFRHTTARTNVDSLLGRHGVVAEHVLRDGKTFLVSLPVGWTVDSALTEFGGKPAVAHVEPNYFCRFAETLQMSQAFLDATSPSYSTGVSPNRYYDQYAIATTSMASGHAVATGAGRVIAQVDNGVDFSHPLLAPHLASNGYDFVDFDNDPSYQSGLYAAHGTFSAGLLVLAAPGATILPIRSLDGDGVGTAFGVTLGIEYAIEAHVDVLCLEFGVASDTKVVRDAVTHAAEAGIIVIAPAGNDSTSALQYPAAYKTVVGVAAVDSLDIKAGFSNYGLNADICAPGADMYSALPGGDLWGRWNGTSFAAPLAAGLAALVRQLHPSIPAASCQRILEWGADPVDSNNPSYAGQLGWGRLNFARSTGDVDAVWGWVRDTSATGVPDVTVTVTQEDSLLSRLSAVTDATGFYTSAMAPGEYELAFSPKSGSGVNPLKLSELHIQSDTTVSAILQGQLLPDSCNRPGDVNRDGFSDLFDIVLVIRYAFSGTALPVPTNGCPPGNADIDCNGSVDVFDIVRLIDYIFKSGPAPSSGC